jgi:glyoxylase-like metal-dependent hydrolase (beta-lactamase superfamily II)
VAVSSPLQFPFRDPPAPGALTEVARGVHWLRMPLPFALDHINLWLLEDGEGWTVVDCGIGNDATRALWNEIFSNNHLKVNRVVATHCHPDHAGNADWITSRFQAPLWMAQAEFLTAHAMRDGAAGYAVEAMLALYRRHGLDESRHALMATRGNSYRRLVPELPTSYHRLMPGARIEIGGRQWRTIVGYGHAPEHLSLYCEELGLLISGDMLLPKISTNVSVWPVDPEGDPLRLFLDSIRGYLELPAATLVLPSHGMPFRGAHERVAQLEAHHAARFAELEQACGGEARSANDLVAMLFRRELDAHQLFFALGEAIAHLNYLQHDGRVRRETGADGVIRFAAARKGAWRTAATA